MSAPRQYPLVVQSRICLVRTYKAYWLVSVKNIIINPFFTVRGRYFFNPFQFVCDKYLYKTAFYFEPNLKLSQI